MKQVVRKVVTLLVVMALAVGTLCQGTMAEAKEKHKFVHDNPKPNKNFIGFDGIALMVETSKGSREVSTGMDSFSPIEIKQGKSAYAYIDLPKYSKAKSSSLTSSNKKVLKIVNKKQGKIKALKAGTTKLTAKVKWKYTGKARKFEYPVLKKISKSIAKNYGADTTHIIKAKKLKLKKGKTYTFKVTVTVRVLCKSHKYSAWKTTKKATCSNGGEKQRKCNKCGTVVTKWLDQLPHQYGEWKETKPATCEEEGEKTRVCSVCKEEETDYIDKLPHQYDSTTHRCTVCGEYENND